jgi:hypothetical protein
MPAAERYSECGVLDEGRAAIRGRVLSAWDGFLRLAEDIDLDASTRLPGWRAREVCVHLGSWPDYQPVNGVLAAARAARSGGQAPGRPDAALDPDALNATITAAHRHADRSEILAALRRARDEAAAYLAPDEPQELDDVPVVSTVGLLPALTIIHAQCYELAVHGLDLHVAGASAPPDALLSAGLAALTDATGALAVRVGITSTASVRSEIGSWAFHSSPSGWVVGHWGERGSAGTPAPPFGGKLPVRIDASAAALLDTSAARINPLKAIATRTLKVHGLPGLLGLTPIVEAVPGIPGGPALRVAARALAGAGGVMVRLSRL